MSGSRDIHLPAMVTAQPRRHSICAFVPLTCDSALVGLAYGPRARMEPAAVPGRTEDVMVAALYKLGYHFGTPDRARLRHEEVAPHVYDVTYPAGQVRRVSFHICHVTISQLDGKRHCTAPYRDAYGVYEMLRSAHDLRLCAELTPGGQYWRPR